MYVPQYSEDLSVGSWTWLKCSVHVNGFTLLQLPQVLFRREHKHIFGMHKKRLLGPSLNSQAFDDYIIHGYWDRRHSLRSGPLHEESDQLKSWNCWPITATLGLLIAGSCLTSSTTTFQNCTLLTMCVSRGLPCLESDKASLKGMWGWPHDLNHDHRDPVQLLEGRGNIGWRT